MAGRETIDPMYAKAKERERILHEEDRLNALYVALTRAKRSLIVCAKEQNSASDVGFGRVRIRAYRRDHSCETFHS